MNSRELSKDITSEFHDKLAPALFSWGIGVSCSALAMSFGVRHQIALPALFLTVPTIFVLAIRFRSRDGIDRLDRAFSSAEGERYEHAAVMAAAESLLAAAPFANNDELRSYHGADRRPFRYIDSYAVDALLCLRNVSFPGWLLSGFVLAIMHLLDSLVSLAHVVAGIPRTRSDFIARISVAELAARKLRSELGVRRWRASDQASIQIAVDAANQAIRNPEQKPVIVRAGAGARAVYVIITSSSTIVSHAEQDADQRALFPDVEEVIGK